MKRAVLLTMLLFLAAGYVLLQTTPLRRRNSRG